MAWYGLTALTDAEIAEIRGWLERRYRDDPALKAGPEDNPERHVARLLLEVKFLRDLLDAKQQDREAAADVLHQYCDEADIPGRGVHVASVRVMLMKAEVLRLRKALADAQRGGVP